MTAPAKFTQADLERVFRASKKTDVQVRIEIEPTGKIVIMSAAGDRSTESPANPWDDGDD